MKNDFVVSFPHMANYYVPINFFLTKGLKLKTIIPPPITKKTLELGSKYSPDFVCSPFKYNLGNYIEALDAGANVLLQAGGACRYGYYGELQEQILKDLGYKFKFIHFSNSYKISAIYKAIKDLDIKINFLKIIYYFLLTTKMINLLDIFEDYLRTNIGFEKYLGSFANLHQQYLKKLAEVNSFKKLKKLHKEYYEGIKRLPLDKPKDCIKVGIVGELYTVMDAFSNHNIEYELAKKGIKITRFITLDYLLFKNAQDEKKILKNKNDYVCYSLGAGGADSVVKSLEFVNKNYDGIIHIKSFGCTPEVNAMPILQKLACEKRIPILYLSFDTATSETGIKTRLEAFYDMLVMRRNK